MHPAVSRLLSISWAIVFMLPLGPAIAEHDGDRLGTARPPSEVSQEKAGAVPGAEKVQHLGVVSPAYQYQVDPCGITFVGVHGLNEGPESKTIHNAFDAFSARIRGGGATLAFVSLDHPRLTSQEFIALVLQGKSPIGAAREQLDSMMRRIAGGCASKRIVLVGYSEGAWIANEWIRNSDLEITSHVVGVVLLGDPQWQRGSEFGIARRLGLAGSGLEINPYIPPQFADRMWSYCIQDDPICGIGYEGAHSVDEQREAAIGAERNIPDCGPHCSYVPSLTDRAAENLAAVAVPSG